MVEGAAQTPWSPDTHGNEAPNGALCDTNPGSPTPEG